MFDIWDVEGCGFFFGCLGLSVFICVVIGILISIARPCSMENSVYFNKEACQKEKGERLLEADNDEHLMKSSQENTLASFFDSLASSFLNPLHRTGKIPLGASFAYPGIVLIGLIGYGIKYISSAIIKGRKPVTAAVHYPVADDYCKACYRIGWVVYPTAIWLSIFLFTHDFNGLGIHINLSYLIASIVTIVGVSKLTSIINQISLTHISPTNNNCYKAIGGQVSEGKLLPSMLQRLTMALTIAVLFATGIRVLWLVISSSIAFITN